ncbi:MAG: hypothetical protein JW804_03675 [Sedimentisphaerales bacterium]|nr:hypothetical protein [Sedimentisphaerales bacterium]
MEHQKINYAVNTALAIFFVCISIGLVGCEGISGYSTESLYPDNVATVYVKMFENKTFERGIEYELTDALAKQIEASTPYKIVSSADRADTILTGYIGPVGKSILSAERETGRPLEKEVLINATVSWKNLKTGDILLNAEQVSASATYSEWQNQGFAYGSTLAANKLAKRIVEAMEKSW